MDIQEVCKRIMYAVDAIDEHVMKSNSDPELQLATGLLLCFMPKLDPEHTIPEPDHQLTLAEAIELLKVD